MDSQVVSWWLRALQDWPFQKLRCDQILPFFLPQNVEEAIRYILLTKTKFEKFYKSKTSDIIANIFECIEKYDVLIDIGAIFINYTNDDFIKKYNILLSKCLVIIHVFIHILPLIIAIIYINETKYDIYILLFILNNNFLFSPL